MGGDTALHGTIRTQPLPRMLHCPSARLEKQQAHANHEAKYLMHTYSLSSKRMPSHEGDRLLSLFLSRLLIKKQTPPTSPSLRSEGYFMNLAMK